MDRRSQQGASRDLSTEHDYDSLVQDLSRGEAQAEQPRLVNTAHVKPTTYKTKNGLFSILKDGTVSLDLSAKRRRRFRISADGSSVDSPEQMQVTNAIDGSAVCDREYPRPPLPSVRSEAGCGLPQLEEDLLQNLFRLRSINQNPQDQSERPAREHVV